MEYEANDAVSENVDSNAIEAVSQNVAKREMDEVSLVTECPASVAKSETDALNDCDAHEALTENMEKSDGTGGAHEADRTLIEDVCPDVIIESP